MAFSIFGMILAPAGGFDFGRRCGGRGLVFQCDVRRKTVTEMET